MQGNDKYIISSVSRALQILKMFTAEEPEYTLTELSNKCQISKASVLRVLLTLQTEKFIRYDEKKKTYSLGIALYQLGSIAFGIEELKKRCYPILREAVAKTGQIIHLAVLANDEIEVVERLCATSKIDVMALSRVGGTVPIHCTGVGAVLSAYADDATRERMINRCDFHKYTSRTITTRPEFYLKLEKVRRLGYSINDGEHEPFLLCLTRPIMDSFGRVVGAFSISVLREAVDEEKMALYQEVSKEVQERLIDIL